MLFSLNDPIVGKPRFTADDALAYAKAHNAKRLDFLSDYLKELWRLGELTGLDASLLCAQSLHECTDPVTGDAWSSYWYVTRGNMAGIGITGDPAQDDASRAWASGADAARAQVVHMGVYCLHEASVAWSKLFDYQHLDPRISDVVRAGFANTVHVLGDLGNGRWATDPAYAQKIMGRANELLRFAAAHPDGGTTPMPEPPIGQYITDIPGLPGGPLRTTYPITMRIVPEGQTLNRPGIKARSPRRSVQHGNGNPNALAAADAQWLFNGARTDAGVPQQLSYNATADDTGVTICIPLDEVTWQAADGDGPGNMCGYSCEMSEYRLIRQTPERLRTAIAITADFMGRCAARLNANKPERHWDFNFALPAELRHHCPDMLMSDTIDGQNAWAVYVAQWTAARADELTRMQVKPTPAAPEPFAITWDPTDVEPLRYGRAGEVNVRPLYGRVTASPKRAIPLYQGATRKTKVVHRLQPNESAIIRGVTLDAAGKPWYFVEYAPGKVGRSRASNFQERYPGL